MKPDERGLVCKSGVVASSRRRELKHPCMDTQTLDHAVASSRRRELKRRDIAERLPGSESPPHGGVS